MLAGVKLIYLKSHTSVNFSAVLDGLLAIFSTFKLHFISNRKYFLFPIQLNSSMHLQPPRWHKAGPRKLLRGGFVFLLEDREFFASGIMF